MKSLLIRYIGYWLFSLCCQFLFWIAKVNPLDEINVFTYPRLFYLPLLGSIIWVVLDALQNRSFRGINRHLVFWVPMLILAGICVVIPFTLSKDGLATGILSFLFLYWWATIGVYKVLLESIFKLRKNRGYNSAGG
jgi:hypothetical protein